MTGFDLDPVQGYKLIAYLENAAAQTDEDDIDVTLTRSELFYIISVIEED